MDEPETAQKANEAMKEEKMLLQYHPHTWFEACANQLKCVLTHRNLPMLIPRPVKLILN